MPSFNFDVIVNFVLVMLILVISIDLHEFSHAIVADRLGDPTPRRQGRITLNPLAHLDRVGTVMIVLSSLAGFGIGWGKPVQINPVSFTRKFRMKTSHLLVALAGPMMNVALGLLVTLIYAVLLATDVLRPQSPLATGVVQVIYLNFILFVFSIENTYNT